jgi:serpin B
MSKFRLTVILASLTLIFTSRSGAQESSATSPASPDIETVVAETALLVGANNNFTAGLYRQIQAKPGNIFVSGYSLAVALDMTFAGARGETASQMQQTLTLHFDSTQLPLKSSMLMSSLNSRQGYQLSVANALWGQSGFNFRPEFLDLTQKFYSAGFKQADFSKPDTREKACQEINSWVEDNTRQKIKNIINPLNLSELTRLVLVNAIYFKAAWLKQFEKSLTKDADFTRTDGRKVKAPLMHNTDNFGYAETAKLQVLKLPYAQNDMSMYIILPKDPADLVGLEVLLNSNQLKNWFDSVKDREVAVTLPRFKIEKKYELNDVLSGMGMRDAFDDKNADFSGMAVLKPDERLFISKVIHQTFVEVDEQGTEAAAATAVVMDKAMAVMNPPKPVEFMANHPFIFAICDNATNSILFMGRLEDPSSR